MGQALTTEEELFRRGEFSDALLTAAEREPPVSATRMPSFIMTPVEWEVLGTLCDNADSAAHVRAAAAKIDMAGDMDLNDGSVVTMYCPLVSCVAQLIAADCGVLPRDIAAERWSRTFAMMKGVRDSAAANTPLGWTEPQHAKLLDIFRVCTEMDPADARGVRRAIGNALDAAADSPTGFGKRPVIALLLTYCAVSVALRCAHFYDAKGDGDDEAHRTASDMLMRAVDAIHTGSAVLKKGVRVGFFEAALERASTSLFNNELRDLVLHRPQRTDASSTDSAARDLTWETIGRSFVGQRHAVEELRSHYQARAEGLTPSEKPTVLVFFGPSGHGKTELGRLVASIESGGGASPEETGDLVLVHMTSYCTRDSIYSLVDPPAAHVGEGLLISALRKKPGAVVVLDEFEKSTADAVQNVWLSAFPRNGMLRSLKDSSRSVSTSKATFILTCNTLSDTIDGASNSYVTASATRKAAMRDEWAAACRQALREQFGEPFVARIDKFVPFVPYDVAETRSYVAKQLDHVNAKLGSKGRRMEATESFVAFATGTMAERGFHGSRVESMLQPHLLALAEHSKSGGSAASNRMLLHARPTMEGAPTIERYLGADALKALGLEAATALARCWLAEETSAGATDDAAPSFNVKPDDAAADVPAQPPTPPSPPAAVTPPASDGAATSSPTPASAPKPSATERVTELEKLPLARETDKATMRVVELEKELETERAKNKELTREVETLKETIKQLQTALALALSTILVLLAFLSLFVSLSTLISFAAMGILALQYFVGNAGFILSVAVSGIVQLLGPARALAVAGVLFAWLVSHGYPSAGSCPPCQRDAVQA